MTVSDEIHIAASPDVVWAVTRDVEQWPEWTPTVTSVRITRGGQFGVGSVARIKQPLQPESEWTVTAFDIGKRFAWETRRIGLHLIGTHDLQRAGSGTLNILTVEARGFLAVLLWPVLRPAMRRALVDENRGLKARCQQISSR